MAFSSIQTVGFRNLLDSEVDIRFKEIFLVGENGHGKSNFLESLYFCSYASSFRGVRDSELIRNGASSCSVRMRIHDKAQDSVSIKLADGKKSISIDEKKIDDRKQLLSVSPVIIFCHEDMEFAAGSPEKRRWFFDQSLSIYDILYIDDLRKYKKVLKIRNSLLKDKNSTMLDVIDPQIAMYGIEIMTKRHIAANEFSNTLSPLYEKVSGIGSVQLKYSPSWKNHSIDSIVDHLKSKRDVDIAFGSTMSGPHRDRYNFVREGKDFSAQASTGQRRLLALLLRVAQANRYKEMTKVSPILLLDDVLLELDPEKRRLFTSVLPEYEQSFFTFLPEEPYHRYRTENTMVYSVKNGHLEAL